MLAALRARRWQGFTAVVLVAIIGFGFLSRWQWQRAEEKRVAQQAQTLAEQAPVVPRADEPLPEFTAITLTGQYAAESVRFVRQRPLEGHNGSEEAEEHGSQSRRDGVVRDVALFTFFKFAALRG